MLKSLVKKIGLALMTLFLAVSSAYASGKMEVLLGDTVRLQPEELGINANYEWVLSDSQSEIITTQTQETFNYTFLEGGEYKVALKATDRSGNEKITSIMVLVGDLYNADRLSGDGEEQDFSNKPLQVAFSTLPALGVDNTIPVIGEGTVLFDIDVSRSDIIEYRIDRNIFVDSDGDGTANNDIDNAADDSYLRGGIWETVYTPNEAAKIVPEITVVTTGGEQAKAQASVVFENEPSATNLVAVIDILPQPKSNAQVELYDDVQIVGIYSRASTGNILEYRIDENIFVDSDRDGNPSNDIDNLNHPSFETGDVWTTTYQKTTDQIIAQLTVVSKGGRASRIQREVIFTDRPTVDLDPGQATEVFIAADKTVVLKQDPVVLTVEGLAERPGKYTFDWDLDGDGESDKLIEGDNTLTHLYEEAGLYTVTALVTDEEGNQAELVLELLVKEAEKTTADFEYTVDGATVTFTNLSEAAFGLTNDTLRYTWSFGDSDEASYQAQEDQIGVENPVYTYSSEGTYVVNLTVVDAEQRVDEKTVEIMIEEAPEGSIENGDGDSKGDRRGIGKILLTLLKWIGIILLVVLLAGGVGLGSLILVIKLQKPELSFGEALDEVKLKILSLLGVHDLIEETPNQDTAAIEESLQADLANKPDPVANNEPVEAEVLSPKGAEARKEQTSEPSKTPASTEHLSKMAGGIDFDAAPGTEGPMPEWLKKAQAQSGKSNPKQTATAKSSPPPTQAKPKPTPNKENENKNANGKKANLDHKKQDDQEGEDDQPNKDDKGGPKEPTPPPSGGNGPMPDWLKAGQAGQSIKAEKKQKESNTSSTAQPKTDKGQSTEKEALTPLTPSKTKDERGGEEKVKPTPNPAYSEGLEKNEKRSAPIPDGLKKSTPQPTNPSPSSKKTLNPPSQETQKPIPKSSPPPNPITPAGSPPMAQQSPGQPSSNLKTKPSSEQKTTAPSSNKTTAEVQKTLKTQPNPSLPAWLQPVETQTQKKEEVKIPEKEATTTPSSHQANPQTTSSSTRPPWLNRTSAEGGQSHSSPQTTTNSSIAPSSPHSTPPKPSESGHHPTPQNQSDAGQKQSKNLDQGTQKKEKKNEEALSTDQNTSTAAPIMPKWLKPVSPKASPGPPLPPLKKRLKTHSSDKNRKNGSRTEDEKQRSSNELMKDFVSKKAEAPSTPDQKKSEINQKSKNAKDRPKKELPSWLQPSTTGSAEDKAEENKPRIKSLGETLPDPLPPLGKKGDQKKKVSKKGDSKIKNSVEPKGKKTSTKSKKTIKMPDAKNKKQVKTEGKTPNLPTSKKATEHVELSVEDLQKGGEFNL